MPIIIPPNSLPDENLPASGAQTGSTATGQITDELVNQVAERVMALLLQDIKVERERRRAVGRPDRLKGVR